MRPSLFYHFLNPLRMMELQQQQLYRLQEQLFRPWWRAFEEIPREISEIPGEIPQAIQDSSVNYGKKKFVANINVRNFKPEQISVKVSDNVVTVEGKREESPSENAFFSSTFVKKYVLPKGHDVDKLETTLSTDGVLTISAPKLNAELEEEQVRSIPIKRTGKPAIAEGNSGKNKEE